MVLTLYSGLLILCQRDNNWEVTNCTERRMQEHNFCHDSFENLAKTRQARQGAVGLCQKMVTLNEIIELYFVLL